MGNKTQSWQRGIFRHEKIRFALVGAVNTFVDFAVLLTLTLLFSVPVLLANIFSTTCALIVSYLLNKQAVFGNTSSHNPRQITVFVVVTLSGIWGLQSLIILGVNGLVHGMLGAAMTLVFAKICATVASLIWNYLWYKSVVFKKESA